MSAVQLVLIAAAAVVLSFGRPPAAARVRREEPRAVVARWWPLYAAAVAGAGLAAGVAGAVAGGLGALFVRRKVAARRAERAVDAQDAAALVAYDVMIGELAVGAAPFRACLAAAQDCADRTLAAEFGRLAAVVRLGGVPGAGLTAPAARNLARSWSRAERLGLPLADVWRATRDDLAARIRHRGRVRASLAGARATAVVLATLPAFAVLLGEAMGAGPLTVLRGGGLGGVLLVVGTGLVLGGLTWSERIAAGAVR